VSARVVVRIRAGVTRSFEIGEKPAFLGRDKAAAVSVPVEGVSRHHARIVWDGKHHWLEDVKSTNGTFLNGKPVSRERLQHLDVITLGRQIDLVFLQQSAAAAAKVQGVVKAALVRDAPDATVHEIAPGEIALGRGPSCNVVAESGAVSKVHARIERTREHLLLEDLGSSNGTFVNDVRVTSAFLKDGDRISLAGVEAYLVSVEIGEITSSSGRFSGVVSVNTGRRSRFNADWKTRYDWSTSEQMEIANLRERLVNEDRAREDERRRRGAAGRAQGKGSTLLPPKPAPAPAKPLAAAGARPPSPLASKTAPAVAPAPAPPPATKTAPPAAPPPASPPPAAAPAATAPRAKEASFVSRPADPPILEVRLSGPSGDLVVREPGAHDLGRASEVPLRVSHPTVSRRHARIILSEDRKMAYVQDGGGANGTRLNGQEVVKLAGLTEGDTIQIGEVTLKVSLKRG
jgi:pSer/pThr/pTyr-binding forkhead associated (FHA) protein